MAFGQPTYYQQPYMQYGQMQNYTAPQYITPIQNQQQYPTLIGKVAENIETIMTLEVPIGGFGVYPLSDMSKVIVKSYDKDGNLQYLTYDLVKPDEPKFVDPYVDRLDDIYDYIAKLDKKIDGFSKSSSPTAMKKRRQGVDEDDA